MCYLIFFSTTDKRNFGDSSSAFFQIEPIKSTDPDDVVDSLAHPFKWYLASRYGGCSCHYRHWPGGDPLFGPPVDWFPEDEDDVEATAGFYDFVSSIVHAGHNIDVIDIWGPGEEEAFPTTAVRLSEVSRADFRFVENHRLDLVP